MSTKFSICFQDDSEISFEEIGYDDDEKVKPWELKGSNDIVMTVSYGGEGPILEISRGDLEDLIVYLRRVAGHHDKRQWEVEEEIRERLEPVGSYEISHKYDGTNEA